MPKFFRTVKSRVITMLLFFTVIVTALVVSFSYYLIYTYQLRTSLQSTEFGLRIAAQSINKDLGEIKLLVNWCSQKSNLPYSYLTREYSPSLAVRGYNRMWEEYRINRANRYIKRLLVVDEEASKILHIGDNTSRFAFSNGMADSPLFDYDLSDGLKVFDITDEPFSLRKETAINILAPIYAQSDSQIIGRVYASVYSSLVTDALSGYDLPNSAELLLKIGEKYYKIEDKDLMPVEEIGVFYFEESSDKNETFFQGKYKSPTGKTLDCASCTVQGDIELLQVFDVTRALPSADNLLFMLIVICILIIVLSFVIIFTMNRTISKPVENIRKKLGAISKGDFSYDESIESNSEIGDVGKGINQLSNDIVQLMNTRISDEQQKQELEYRMLQSQINPHFLYNTLSAIKWMATLQKAEGIAEMTTALSRLLKTVSKDLRKVVPLRDEIALLDDYYLILKYRYGGTVSFEKYIEDENLLKCEIPRFVLQPIMENAIFHGIEGKGHGEMKLYAERHGEKVHVSLWDNGTGMTPEVLEEINTASSNLDTEEKNASIGINNVRSRIQSVFGDEYGLEAESEHGAYTKITIIIPYKIREDNQKGE